MNDLVSLCKRCPMWCWRWLTIVAVMVGLGWGHHAFPGLMTSVQWWQTQNHWDEAESIIARREADALADAVRQTQSMQTCQAMDQAGVSETTVEQCWSNVEDSASSALGVAVSLNGFNDALSARINDPAWDIGQVKSRLVLGHSLLARLESFQEDRDNSVLIKRALQEYAQACQVLHETSACASTKGLERWEQNIEDDRTMAKALSETLPSIWDKLLENRSKMSKPMVIRGPSLNDASSARVRPEHPRL